MAQEVRLVAIRAMVRLEQAGAQGTAAMAVRPSALEQSTTRPGTSVIRARLSCTRLIRTRISNDSLPAQGGFAWAGLVGCAGAIVRAGTGRGRALCDLLITDVGGKSDEYQMVMR